MSRRDLIDYQSNLFRPTGRIKSEGHQMRYDKATLKRIYDRTTGYCHLCGKKLAFSNYAQRGRRGAWEVEHSRPRSKGGHDHLNNLYAACVDCNRDKSAVTTQTSRGWHGRSKAPLSKQNRKIEKRKGAVAGGVLGAVVGAALVGPVGAWIGGGIGAVLGHGANSDRD